MVIQIVKFESELGEEELLATAQARLEQFRALPGLVQKYYYRMEAPRRYGGVYFWDSMESLRAFRETELAATIPKAYRIKGEPEVEIMEILFPLRDR